MAYFPIHQRQREMKLFCVWQTPIENDENNKMRSFKLGKVNNISQSTLTK